MDTNDLLGTVILGGLAIRMIEGSDHHHSHSNKKKKHKGVFDF